MPPAAVPTTGDGQLPDGWQRAETLGVAEVVMTILKARKAIPAATAATVSRERRGDAFHVRVSLTEETGDATARVIADFVAGQLGQDLTDAFDGKDVIVLK
jgi:hypothetical protein